MRAYIAAAQRADLDERRERLIDARNAAHADGKAFDKILRRLDLARMKLDD